LSLGVGGERDSHKRKIMGTVAQRFADGVIVTDDNPRNEDPKAIRDEISQGCPQAKEIGDRAEAIAYAIGELQAGDVLVVAGKGHEQEQRVGSKVIPFKDKNVIHAVLAGK